ncbi:phosphodiester glycosidase family protein [Hyunsoonleella pacifica]|uniref:Phosphodiester glycosidase family protein n=1 Tax=Hyunsoonleella pacifica TaxID=1080224 RepID=A0A4Q9FUI9_9FLAO|nr:phosphodiester glycosidase family protein [Hyunsoonleella pacifica]TBN17882.1 phosphodiester glycosidase family protein [Hyunsoonleella pacifica]GGD08107.1 hypothetical protein GCM10011368_07600 [Hyunsoonleella pacifica]
MKNLIIILIVSIMNWGCGHNKSFFYQKSRSVKSSIDYIQIKNDSIFDSNQIISLLTINKKDINNFNVKFGHNSPNLNTTSILAESNNAIAAINGGFFDINNGQNTTYFEINNTIINRKKISKKKSMLDILMNGAIVIKYGSEIIIQHAKSEQFYESSKQESAVLISCPLLLIDSKALELPHVSFVDNRHPRTCLCNTKDSTIFITIDGRSMGAEGMSLSEAQSFLLSLGCINAINLDGGGSTTMWIKDKGVVSYPSDKNGERPVSNALLIVNK